MVDADAVAEEEREVPSEQSSVIRKKIEDQRSRSPVTSDWQ